ncbi:S-adenosyl-L-methionine-dependent methyltransferase [Apodospora peruviana]|uniref:S-adenosyl-L-methionine-dependent methyltransferase n=1 Tax=Apodospora peruviana TaxID=516989 RepID=A0AAE0HX69_9PEZI|nr:S-adenosyl-L-methionine-dependent methyltransferase [Apodospora peruviana]
MASTTNNTTPGSQEYFTWLAANHAKLTGNSTRDLFAASLEDITTLHPITSSSRIHDNAAGPGTAASVLVSQLPSSTLPTGVEILITDNVPAMLTAAREHLSSFPTITIQEMDSLDLKLPDSHLSHTILNFSIFNMADPLKCLQETHRTLKEGGIAALLTWRRFGAAEVIRAAQEMVRPDLPPIFVPREEFTREGVLADLAVDAGFNKEKMTVLSKRVVVTGDDLDNLSEFFPGLISEPARKGWTEQERARWPEVVDKAIQGEVEEYGGVLFEAWVVLAWK